MNRPRFVFVTTALAATLAIAACSSPRDETATAPTGSLGQMGPADAPLMPSPNPANPSDQGFTGPYEIVPDWPKPVSTWPGGEGWTWGAMQAVFVESQNRIFLGMRGLLPELKTPGGFGEAGELITVNVGARGPVRLLFPVTGGPMRNASVMSPGEVTDLSWAVEGQDYKWEHIITVVDAEGNLVEDWTQWDSLFKPRNMKRAQGRVHKIRISPYDPEKRVWAIDDGNHVIRIFSNDGKELLQTIGTFGEAADDEAHFAGRPNDIAWLPDGTFFVADGYEGARVAKFDKDGKFLMRWGQRGEEGGNEKRPGYFNTVHGIAVDAQRRVYVVDRSNRRIQIFDENGNFLNQWYLGDLSATYNIEITDDQFLWLSDGHGNFKMYKYDLNGRMLYEWGTKGVQTPGEIWGVHQFSVDSDGNLYTACVWGGRPQKFRPRQGVDPRMLVGQPVRAAWK